MKAKKEEEERGMRTEENGRGEEELWVWSGSHTKCKNSWITTSGLPHIWTQTPRQCMFPTYKMAVTDFKNLNRRIVGHNLAEQESKKRNKHNI